MGHLRSTEAALLQVALTRIQATASAHLHSIGQDLNNSIRGMLLHREREMIKIGNMSLCIFFLSIIAALIFCKELQDIS